MTEKEYEQIITRQDEFGKQCMALHDEMIAIQNEMLNVLEKIPVKEIYEKYFPGATDGKQHPLDILDCIIRFRVENPEKAAQLNDELFSYPDYKEYLNKLQEFDDIKYRYYYKLFAYYKMINDDRKNFFDEEYMKTVDALADRGIFLYYQQTPDMNLEGKTVDEAEKFVLECYTVNECSNLHHMFREVVNQPTDNPLQTNKTSDLIEALICLRYGMHQSCARTLFALLDNEHNNASSLYSRSSGKERAEAIDNYVKEMGIEYYSKVWTKLNNYYRLLNCDTDKMDENDLNRHDLMHGTYKHIATKEDCVKLFLLYATFKELSFYLQQMIDFRNDIKQDIIINIIKQNSKQPV